MSNPWQDITEQCRSAALELTQSSPMIHVRDFSLLDAMSAVELMEPKMDQFFNLSLPRRVSDLYRVGPQVMSTGSKELLLQLLIINEAAFIDGASLLESTHRFVLLWEESWVEASNSDVVWWFARNMHASLSNINRAVLAADIYEEEDFQPLSSPPLRTDVVLENWVGDEESSGLNILVEYRWQMSLFMDILHRWIVVCMLTARQSSHGTSSPEFQALAADFDRCNSRLQDTCTKILSLCQGGILLDPSSSTVDQCAEIQWAFNDLLVKRLQINPVRAVRQRSFCACIQSVLAFCQDFSRVSTVVGGFRDNGRGVHFNSLLAYTLDFSQSRPHLLARSLYVALLRGFCHDAPAIIIRSLESQNFPSELLALEVVREKWLPVVGKICWETLKCLCVHRNKLFSRLDPLLASWGTIVSEASYIDHQYQTTVTDLAGPPSQHQWCAYWCMHIAMALMDLHLGLMMEMNLLSRCELDYFYWYWDYISNTRAWAMEKLRLLRDEQLSHNYMAAHARQLAESKLKSKKKGKQGTLPKQDPPAPVMISVEEIMVKAKGQLCRGQCRVLIAASNLGISSVVKPHLTHSTWDLRFEQRFRSFQNIANPPPLAYSDYRQTLEAGAQAATSAASLLDNASVCFGNTKKYIEYVRKSVADGGPSIFDDQPSVYVGTNLLTAADKLAKLAVTSALKVAVANSISIMKSTSNIKKISLDQQRNSLDVVIDFTHSQHFPSIEIKDH